MSEKTRIYKVDESGQLKEVKPTTLNLEERIQTWVEKDIDIISSNLLVIGREVETSHGGFIDILCLDSRGDTVVLELKRNKTPRDVTAQTLDYGSWVNDLSHDEITRIADEYFDEEESLAGRFLEKFGSDLPETLNTEHKLLVVGSTIDASTERIIHYLSEKYGVGINAVTFTFHELDGQEYLSRNMVIEEADATVQQSRASRSKRKRYLTLEEFQGIMEEKDLLPLFDQAVNGLTASFGGRNTTGSTVTFTHDFNGHKNSVLSLEPMQSTKEKGLQFYLNRERFVALFGDNMGIPDNLLGIELYQSANQHYGNEEMFSGVFQDEREIDTVVKGLQKNKKW